MELKICSNIYCSITKDIHIIMATHIIAPQHLVYIYIVHPSPKDRINSNIFTSAFSTVLLLLHISLHTIKNKKNSVFEKLKTYRLMWLKRFRGTPKMQHFNTFNIFLFLFFFF
eukprot:533431_1